MTLREYEENIKKVKRNNKATKNKLPITVPSLHLNPPKFAHDSIPIQESLISLRPTKDASVIKRQIPNTTPASSIRTVNEEVSTKIQKTNNNVYVDKIPISVPSLHLKPPKYEPDQIPTKKSSMRYKKQTSSTKSTMSKTTPSSEGILTYPKRLLTPPEQIQASKPKGQENILKNPISIPISRQGTFVGHFPAANTKSKNPFGRKGAKPPLPQKPFGTPQPSPSTSFSKTPPLHSSFSSSNFSPSKKPLTSFTYKKAVPEAKVATKSPFSKDVFKKHKRKSTKSISIPLAGKCFNYLNFLS